MEPESALVRKQSHEHNYDKSFYLSLSKESSQISSGFMDFIFLISSKYFQVQHGVMGVFSSIFKDDSFKQKYDLLVLSL